MSARLLYLDRRGILEVRRADRRNDSGDGLRGRVAPAEVSESGKICLHCLVGIHFASACPDAALFLLLAGRLATLGP